MTICVQKYHIPLIFDFLRSFCLKNLENCAKSTENLVPPAMVCYEILEITTFNQGNKSRRGAQNYITQFIRRLLVSFDAAILFCSAVPNI